MAYNDEPRVSITLTQKVNLGNYESAEVGVHLTQIPYLANEAMITQMLATAEMTFGMLRPELNARVAEAVRMSRSAEDIRTMDAQSRQSAVQQALGVQTAPPAQETPPAPVEPAPKGKGKGKEPSPPTSASTAQEPPAPATPTTDPKGVGTAETPAAPASSASPVTETPNATIVLEGASLEGAMKEALAPVIPLKCPAFGVDLDQWPAKEASWTSKPKEQTAALIGQLLTRHTVPQPDIRGICYVVLSAFGIAKELHQTQAAAMIFAAWLDKATDEAFDQAYLALTELRKLEKETDPFVQLPEGRGAVAA